MFRLIELLAGLDRAWVGERTRRAMERARARHAQRSAHRASAAASGLLPRARAAPQGLQPQADFPAHGYPGDDAARQAQNVAAARDRPSQNRSGRSRPCPCGSRLPGSARASPGPPVSALRVRAAAGSAPSDWPVRFTGLRSDPSAGSRRHRALLGNARPDRPRRRGPVASCLSSEAPANVQAASVLRCRRHLERPLDGAPGRPLTGFPSSTAPACPVVLRNFCKFGPGHECCGEPERGPGVRGKVAGASSPIARVSIAEAHHAASPTPPRKLVQLRIQARHQPRNRPRAEL